MSQTTVLSTKEIITARMVAWILLGQSAAVAIALAWVFACIYLSGGSK